MTRMDSLLRDLRYGLRRVVSAPGFTAIATLTLALGIGANVAIFTVVNAVLIRPLPFPNPDRLVRIAADARATNGRNIGLSQPELLDLRDRAGIFDGDHLIVSRAIPAKPGHVVVACLNGDVLVKRLAQEQGQFILRSENPAYSPRYILENDELTIWGVVTHSLRNHLTHG